MPTEDQLLRDQLIESLHKPIAHADLFAAIKDFPVPVSKFELFKGAYGTVVYFDHAPTVDGLAANAPAAFKEQVPVWAANSVSQPQSAAGAPSSVTYTPK